MLKAKCWLGLDALPVTERESFGPAALLAAKAKAGKALDRDLFSACCFDAALSAAADADVAESPAADVPF